MAILRWMGRSLFVLMAFATILVALGFTTFSGLAYSLGDHDAPKTLLAEAKMHAMHQLKELKVGVATIVTALVVKTEPRLNTYTVRKAGMSLWKLARKYHVKGTADVVAWIREIKILDSKTDKATALIDPDIIHVGDTLVLPNQSQSLLATTSTPETSVAHKAHAQNAHPEKAVTVAAQDKHHPSAHSSGITTSPSRTLIKHAIRIYEKYGDIILKASREIRVPRKYICGTIIQESGGNPNAFGDFREVKGRHVATSHGIMQIHQPTRIRLGLTIEEALTPAVAIPAGTRLLRKHYEAFGGITRYAISAYNSPAITVAMLKEGQDPGKRTYVRSVLANAHACEQAEWFINM